MESKSMLLVVLIAALLVTVGLQTVQLAAMTGGSGAFTVKTATSAKTGSSTSGSTGSSLQNLPSMVGGC